MLPIVLGGGVSCLFFPYNINSDAHKLWTIARPWLSWRGFGMRSSREAKVFLQAGAPFVAFVLAGFWGLRQFVQTKFDYQDAKRDVLDERAPLEKMTKRKFSLEEEYKLLKEHIDLNTYENKPVPR